MSNKRSYLPLHKLTNRVKARKPIHKPNAQPVVPATFCLNNYRNFTYDQGQLGSCTANAFCASYRLQNIIQNKNVNFKPSRLYFYYYERVIENSVDQDAGADVVDGEKFVKLHGICGEKSWPYDITKFAVKPPANCDVEAQQHKISNYSVIPNDANLVTNIKHAILNKQPVLIAVAVYDSFESDVVASTGLVPIPNIATDKCVGGHEMCLIGYDDNRKLFTVLNSWGQNWGVNGLCYIPYDYLSNPDLGYEFTVFNV